MPATKTSRNPTPMAAPSPQQLLNPASASIFTYGSLNCVLFFFKAPVELVQPMLANSGLLPGIFDGQALINLNFERYAGIANNYFEATTETEFNIVAYPTQQRANVPALTVDQFLSGFDETKHYGNFRAHVACSDPTAVLFGAASGELKILTPLTYNVPSLNSPQVADWWIRAMDPTAAPGASAPYVFDLHARFQDTRPTVSSFSPLRDYAYVTQTNPATGQPARYLVLSFRNVYGQFQRWTPGPDALQLKIGTSTTAMAHDMRRVFAHAEPVGILVFDSPPAASSTHLTYTSPIVNDPSEEA
jgi:hypothetical protein